MKEKFQRKRFSDYGESLIMIFLAVIFFLWTRNPELKGPENTNKISGVLSKPVKSGTHDESISYIGVWVEDCDGFYEFTKCSYNAQIENKISLLSIGDSITLYFVKNRSSTTYPFDGDKYYTYTICAANSPKHGIYLNFSQYNNCLRNKANFVFPILSGLIVLTAIFQIFKTYNDKQNVFDPKFFTLVDTDPNYKYKKLNPNKLAFILRNSGLSILLIIIGLLFNWQFEFSDMNKIGLGLILIGFYLPFHHYKIHKNIYYILDSEGIHIKNVSIFKQPEVISISYEFIKEVKSSQSFYENDLNIGTILIYSGKKGNEGNKVYEKIIGIEKYQETMEYIEKMIELKKNYNQQ